MARVQSDCYGAFKRQHGNLQPRPSCLPPRKRARIYIPRAERSLEDTLLQRQSTLIQETEVLDGGGEVFIRDRWEREPGNPGAGYGITAVMSDGDLLEKAAVNISIINGQLTPERAKAMSSRGREIDARGGQDYSAAALSLVYHPNHPFVPTLRADVGGLSWYGGGCDLTPAYLYEEDAAEFHGFWKRVCERHAPGLYPRYKRWCDEYFYLPARQEHRGVGGIFFDDVIGGQEGEPPDARAFVEDVASGILDSWRGIAERRRREAFDSKQREWQLLRRGRYLEFNLLYDRGVRFGLGGRIESVMVSAPPLIAWKYNVQPREGSREERLVQALRTPREWV